MSLTHNAGHRSAREAVSCSAAPQGLEPVIEGGGTLEADWQHWPGLSVLPEIDFTELTQVCARVVVVAPHPDDEVLACGGLLAMLSDCRHPVTVISVTDGDASHPGSRRWPIQLLAQQRHAEALEALSRLGLKPLDYVRLSLPDGQVQPSRGRFLECDRQQRRALLIGEQQIDVVPVRIEVLRDWPQQRDGTASGAQHQTAQRLDQRR